jgi:hypothetical protein
MKVYGFYFFATLVLLASSFGMDQVDALTYLYFLAIGVVTLAPLRMTRQYREATWIRGLLLVFPLGAWMTFVRIVWGWALDEGFVPSSTFSVFENFYSTVSLVSTAGYLCFVVGCFAVKASPLQRRFRQMAWLCIAVILVRVFLTLSSNRQTTPGWHTVIMWRNLWLVVVTDLLFLPLLLLEYQLWKRPPVEDQLKAAVDAIGLPEES